MKINTRRVSCLCLVLTMSIAFAATGISDPLKTDRNARQKLETHAPGFIARITFPNGTTRNVDVQGVGCSAAMCSRVFITAKDDSHSTARIWLDSLAAIKGVSENAALFVMKDGTERRLGFSPDFRVLYIAKPNGDAEKLDLGTIKSLEIL